MTNQTAPALPTMTQQPHRHKHSSEDPVVIIGGGLSGLTAARQLHRQGTDVLVLEARARLGGRSRSLSLRGGRFDLGGSWVWPQHSAVRQLLRELDLHTFPQFSAGDAIVESPPDTFRQVPLVAPMHDTVRVRGGSAAIVGALAAGLPDACIRLNTQVRALEADGNCIVVKGVTNGKEFQVRARHVAIALPLRLASECEFQPPLGNSVTDRLQSTPTWMAGQAKFLAVYKTAFWRRRGLSGYADSSTGPLFEVHDASVEGEGGPFALFGFVANGALASAADETAFITQALAFLARLFGEEARRPLHAVVADWSKEKWTATSADCQAVLQHPTYRVQLPLQAPWKGRLDFIVSEMHSEHGGFMEGAVGNGKRFAEGFVERK